MNPLLYSVLDLSIVSQFVSAVMVESALTVVEMVAAFFVVVVIVIVVVVVVLAEEGS